MSAAVADASRLTAGGAVRAEWLKFGTLVSNPVAALSALVMIVGLAAVLVWARTGEQATTSTVELLVGVSWAQLLIAVLAVVFVCSEWSSGTSRVTFLAAPTRWPVLLGKAAVMGSVSALVGVLGAGVAVLVGAAGGVDVGADPGIAVRVVIGAGAYLCGIALLALGIGTIVRNLVGGILTVVGFLWVLPMLAALIPAAWVQRLIPYLPAPAGGLLITAENPASQLTPWAGGAVLLGWACAAILVAVVSLRTRDI